MVQATVHHPQRDANAPRIDDDVYAYDRDDVTTLVATYRAFATRDDFARAATFSIDRVRRATNDERDAYDRALVYASTYVDRAHVVFLSRNKFEPRRPSRRRSTRRVLRGGTMTTTEAFRLINVRLPAALVRRLEAAVTTRRAAMAANPPTRSHARAALQSRLTVRQTCADASDLINELEDVLQLPGRGETPTFEGDLRRRLIEETQKEIRSGRLGERSFEELIAGLLSSLGAAEVRIVPRAQDKGVDILAVLSLANTFKFKLGVQAKYYRPDPPVLTSLISSSLVWRPRASSSAGL